MIDSPMTFASKKTAIQIQGDIIALQLFPFVVGGFSFLPIGFCGSDGVEARGMIGIDSSVKVLALDRIYCASDVPLVRIEYNLSFIVRCGSDREETGE